MARFAETLELVLAAVVELETGASDEVADRRGQEYLPSSGEARHPRRNVHGNAARLLASNSLHFPVCKPARIWTPSGESACWIPSAQRIARAGLVEDGEEAVACGVDLFAGVANELFRTAA